MRGTNRIIKKPVQVENYSPPIPSVRVTSEPDATDQNHYC
jgi:hypothetical protein